MGSTLTEAMVCIEKNLQGICFVLNKKRLVGLVTDGDIRRALLDGFEINDSIDLIMNKEFFSLPVGSSFDLIQKNLAKYKHIPIIDTEGILVDMATQLRYHQIPLVQPIFDGNELEYVTDCLNTGWISSQGKYVTLFEEKFGQYVGCSNTLAVSNGTVALHLALIALGIGPGDEVIVPNLTFAAPINAVLYVGATPVMVDVDLETMTINPNLVMAAISNKTKAIIPVHLYGQPADMDDIMSIAKKLKLKVIEDCAEALGSKYKDLHVGSFGDAAIFSFFGNKTITTGEGGMIVFKDPSIRNHAKVLRDHGMSPDRRYWHDEVGYNYRLTNIQAAIGVAQMEKVDFYVDKKRWLAEQYKKRLGNVAFLRLPVERVDIDNSYWLYTVTLLDPLKGARDEIIALLKANGIEARPVFYPLHRMPPYQNFGFKKEGVSISDDLSDGGISLPSSVYASEAEIEKVCSVLLASLCALRSK